MIFNPSRDQVRSFFISAWQKHRADSPVRPAEPIEILAAQWIAEHPEYHPLLENSSTDDALAKDFSPEGGQSNPFLHLSMHLSISEQVSIDQPPGIRAAVETLARKLGSLHEAQHQVIECLGEMLWRAQRTGLPPDAREYLDCIRRRVQR